MPVSALVLTTDDSFGEVHRRELGKDPRVTLGESQGAFLPVVTETESVGESRDLVEIMLNMEGVMDAQLVSWASETEAVQASAQENNHGA